MLISNEWITVKSVPLDAKEYVVNKKSALDWVVDRDSVIVGKASGIVNGFNAYATKMDRERSLLDKEGLRSDCKEDGSHSV